MLVRGDASREVYCKLMMTLGRERKKCCVLSEGEREREIERHCYHVATVCWYKERTNVSERALEESIYW